MVTFEYIQQLTIPVYNFATFLNISVIRILIVCFARLVVDPIHLYISDFQRRLSEHMIRLSRKNERLNFLAELFSQKKQPIRQSDLVLPRPYQPSSVSREMLIRFYVLITSKQSVNIIRVFVHFLPLFFPMNSQKNRMTLQSYLLTLFPQICLSVLNLVVDFFVVYLMERVHGYRVLEYLQYQRVKYALRKTDWLQHQKQLDPSLETNFRSIDFLGFSEQYFYSTIIIGGGVTFMVWGTCTMYSNGYNPFNDRFSLLYLVIFSIVFSLCMFLIRFLENLARIWQRPKAKSQGSFRTSI